MEKQPNAPKPGNEESVGNSSKMSRREFLKKAAIVGGAVAVTTGGYAMLNKLTEVKEGPYRSKASVVRKEYVSAAEGALMGSPIERWAIVLHVDDDIVNVDGKPVPEVISVSKEEFDQF